MTFASLARTVSTGVGSAGFLAAVLALLVVGNAWALALGTDRWLNLAISCLTLALLPLMAFADGVRNLALHAKLDALIHATAGADDALMRAEERSAPEIEALRGLSAEPREDGR